MAHADAVQIGSLWYNLDESAKTAEVTTSGGDVYSGEIVIPSSFEYNEVTYTVTSIGNSAFSGSSISKVTFPSSLTEIGEYAFGYCQDLTILYFSDGLTTVGNNAFDGCWNLEKVIIPSLSAWCSVNFGNYDSNPLYHANHLFLDENTEITKLEIPEGVTTIGSYAFLKCTEVSSVTIPKSVISIGENAFSECNNLEKVIVSDMSAWCSISFGSMDSNPLSRARRLFSDENTEITKLEIPSGLTSIKAYAFSNWVGLTSVVIPNSVTTIGDYAFNGCYNASFESFPSSLTSIGESAFWNCNGITNLSFSSGIETIGDGAFAYCGGLQEVGFPSTLISIGSGAFRGCPIKRLELPASLTSIGEWAFAELNSLSVVISRIEVPFELSQSVFCSSYNSIWDDAESKYVYTYTKSPATLCVPDRTTSAYKAIDGWDMFADIVEGEFKETTIDGLIYSYLEGKGTATVIGRADEELREVNIPGSISVGSANYTVTKIGARAFYDISLQSVNIGEGVETIEKQAFWDSDGINELSLPTTLKTIGDEAFTYAYINSLILPKGLVSIGSGAFRSCYNIQKVELPSTLTSIGDNAFTGCSSLFSVVSRIQTPFEISPTVFGTEGDWNEETQKQNWNPCAATLYVPEGTMAKYKAIEGWTMFREIYEGEMKEAQYGDLYYTYNTSSKIATVVKGENYSELKKVSIPSTITVDDLTCKVKFVGARAFSNTSITSVDIADGVEAIAQEAFQECRQLSAISLPSTLTTIEDGVFRYCYRLNSITIPASVTTLGDFVFSACTAMSYMTVADGNRTYESNGSNAIIETSSKKLLYGCKNTLIPDDITEIGMEAFFNCEIKAVQIPGSVKTIGSSAFNSCRYLTDVTLPEGLETLEGNVFAGCERLETIEFPSTMKNFGEWIVAGCNNLQNVVSNIEEPKEILEYVFGDNYGLYSRATLWVPRGKIDSYKRTSGWNNFNSYDELLHDILTKPTIKYDGHHLVMTNDPEQRAKIYYSTDGAEPTILYSDTVALSNLGVIQAISKRYGSYTVDTARYEVTYVYDGVTARTASGGLLKNAFEWCGTDKIEMLDIDGQLNDEDFATIRGLSKLTVLNMAASKIENSSIPSGAFADMNLEWYVSPYNFTSVGSGIFKGCDKLAALTWNSSSIELPEDVVTDVANPNMLVYAKVQAMIPYTMKNVIVNGVANNIVLVDSAGNNNFRCPEEFLARRITYTHNYQQETKQGQTQGWETLALPFTVSKITHETKGEITPFAVEGAERPFWLYELGGNGMEKATEIRANTPYLICMPNDDAYGDEYMLGGRVTFSATNATITTSGGTTVSRGDRQFVPTYQRVASSSDVYALNVNEVVGDNPVGSVFVPSLREVRPFEAYSVHSTNRARIITVSSLGGGDATGINDLIQNNAGESADDVVKVYSLSGALIKQGKREEVLRSLPNGLYIINGKKIIK